jgi:hypothetical protein
MVLFDVVRGSWLSRSPRLWSGSLGLARRVEDHAIERQGLWLLLLPKRLRVRGRR